MYENARSLFVLKPDALLLAVSLKHHVDRGDNFLVLIRFTINDYAMFHFLGALDVNLSRIRQSVVPAAVPHGHEISVFLERARQLSSAQLLNINIAACVSVRFKLDLRLRRARHQHEYTGDTDCLHRFSPPASRSPARGNSPEAVRMLQSRPGGCQLRSRTPQCLVPRLRLLRIRDAPYSSSPGVRRIPNPFGDRPCSPAS